jgi:hypothetical protein
MSTKSATGWALAVTCLTAIALYRPLRRWRRMVHQTLPCRPIRVTPIPTSDGDLQRTPGDLLREPRTANRPGQQFPRLVAGQLRIHLRNNCSAPRCGDHRQGGTAAAGRHGRPILESAKKRDGISIFHVAALSAGGTDNGPPGLRVDYGADYYAAFAVDPDGYRIEAYCGG